MQANRISGAPLDALAVFFALFIPVTAFFVYATLNWRYSPWITGMMWSVGLSAILTCFALRRPLSTLGWGWGESKYQIAAFRRVYL